MSYSARQALLNLLPGKLRYRLISLKRRSLFEAFRRVGLVYVHVPRTGGTSLSDTVFDFWIDHFTVRQHNLTMPPDVMALPRFSIVRNPWEKLLSTWSFIAMGRGHDERIFVMNRHRFDMPEFATFERFVLDWLPAQDMRFVDHLFLPQINFLRDHANEIHLEHLGRTDRMEVTEAWISERIGRPVSLPHYNRSTHGPYRDCYTSEMRKVVEQIYGEDIERLKFRY